MLGTTGLNARRVGATLAVAAMVSCGGTGARSQSAPAVREPVPLPTVTIRTAEPTTAAPATSATPATAPSSTAPPATAPPATNPAPESAPPSTAPPETNAAPETASPATTSATVSEASGADAPPPPDTTVPPPPTAAVAFGCPLRTLAATAAPDAVAAAFVTVYGTVAAADDQAGRLTCLRSRLSDPLGSPMLTPPSFTAEQMATHWRLDPTTPPALAPDQDSPQSANRVVLTATLRGQVRQDGAEPVSTVSQLLVELINSSGRWLVGSMSNRTVTS